MSKVTITIDPEEGTDGSIGLAREMDEINSADFGMYAPTRNPNNTKAWVVGNMVAVIAAHLMQMSMEDLRKAKVILEPPTTDRCDSWYFESGNIHISTVGSPK